MSDATADSLNIQAVVAQIDRNQAETRKFVAEQAKLTAEAAKLRRDWFLAPILAAGVLGGAVAAVLPIILRSWGVH